MADSFEDLWASNAPIQPKSKPQTLSAYSSSGSRPGSSASGSQKPDVFALLSSNARPNAASIPSSRPISALGAPIATARSGTSTPSLASKPAGDAFSDLFASASSTSTSASTSAAAAGMTLAARLAQDAMRRGGGSPVPSTSTPRVAATKGDMGGVDAWAGLDVLSMGAGGVGAGAGGTVKLGKTNGVDDTDDWGLGDFGTPPARPKPNVQRLGARPGARTATTTTTSSKGVHASDLLDLGDFGGSAMSGSGVMANTTPPPSQSKSNTNTFDSPDADFDFGTREDGYTQPGPDPPSRRRRSDKGLLDLDDLNHQHEYAFEDEHDPRTADGLLFHEGGDEGEDDVLGALAKPVHEVRKEKRNGTSQAPPTRSSRSASPNPNPSRPSVPPRPNPNTNTNTNTNARARAPSPPPHVLGQIVEMGFSVKQARVALADTRDGQGEWDVQRALEVLLGAGSGGGSGSTLNVNASASGSSTSSARTGSRMTTTNANANPGGTDDTDISEALQIQDHADKLISQASEIGGKVWSKASAFWKEGRERVVKVYEERAAPGGGGGSGSGSGSGGGSGGGSGQEGRPRWMQDAQTQGKVVAGAGAGSGGGSGSGGGRAFRYDEDGEVEGVYVRRRRDREGTRQKAERFVDEEDGGALEGSTSTKGGEPQCEPEEEVDLFSHAPSKPVASTSRSTSVPQPKIPQIKTEPSNLLSTSTLPPTSTSASPRPFDLTTLPSIPPPTLTLVLTHKNAGTAAFKLGQYAASIASYTAALEMLPRGHLLSVPLLTNRALARLRNGEVGGCVRDAGWAVGVVLGVCGVLEGGGEGGGEGRELGGDGGGGGGNGNGAGGLDEFDPTSSMSSSTKLDIGPRLTPHTFHPSLLPSPLLTASSQKLNDSGWSDPTGRGVGVDLVEGFVKAVRRRAEGLEGRERWGDAAGDWGVLCVRGGRGEWVQEGVRREAGRGVGRCVGMGGGGAGGGGAGVGVGAGGSIPKRVTPKPTSGPATKPKPAPRPSTNLSKSANADADADAPSAALLALQSQSRQLEADENQRHALKDSVDARLGAWKKGKEGNVRALLASLEMVLWEGLLEGNVKVKGMHELVTPAQVKKAYVRAIGRVHPDKLNAQNSTATVEQKMLANGVFGALNEAWIAFQSQS